MSKITTYIRMVKEFHKAMLLPVRDNPDQFSEKDLRLRINLLQEELDEMEDSWENEDFEQVKLELLDALCDLQYVLSGAILQLGFKDVFDEAFAAVHESNMTKIIKKRENVEKELYRYKKKGVPCKAEETSYGWIIKRSSDGKILKPSRYSPVNLSGFLNFSNGS